jgi:hypothetical protein
MESAEGRDATTGCRALGNQVVEGEKRRGSLGRLKISLATCIASAHGVFAATDDALISSAGAHRRRRLTDP